MSRRERASERMSRGFSSTQSSDKPLLNVFFFRSLAIKSISIFSFFQWSRHTSLISKAVSPFNNVELFVYKVESQCTRQTVLRSPRLLHHARNAKLQRKKPSRIIKPTAIYLLAQTSALILVTILLCQLW